MLDIGSVLEDIDDEAFPAALRGEQLDHGGDPMVGEVTEAEVYATWQRALALDDPALRALVESYWRWYVGSLDTTLFAWFAGQRPARRTGILSNSGPGARERERPWGFEEVTDVLVYSHEVGLKKPDPRIYELTRQRLGVAAHEVVFLDDVPGHVEAAREAGWHAVVHHDTQTSINQLEELIEREARSRPE